MGCQKQGSSQTSKSPLDQQPFTHLQKSHSNGGNKSHGQFQQKPCTLDVQNLKNGLKKNFIIGHQRKSPFCTFSCINLGFGRPWDMLQKNFLIAIFIMLQKNTFGQKQFQISCTGSKVPFWQFFQIGTFETMHEI